MNTHLARESKVSARISLAVLAILAVAGIALGWNRGQLPHPEIATGIAGHQTTTAADLLLYREIIAEVRGGGDYYAACSEKLPQFGFPVSSPFNWRLPTYAWLLGSLPNNFYVQIVLLILATAGMGLAFVVQWRQNSLFIAAATALLLFGVVRWTFDGEAFLAQEVWAAVLLLISISAQALGRESRPNGTRSAYNTGVWITLSILSGTSALLFRELALPYCLIAYTLAAWNRRWLEALGWGVGLVLFGLLLGWHTGQVQGHLAGIASETSAGLSQWLRFGGLDFVLLTTRMNSLLFAAPAVLLWLYILAALVGMARRTDETSRLCCLTALSYLLAFAIVGRPENFYWGLLAAPFLAWGVAGAPKALADLFQSAKLSTTSPVPSAQTAPSRPAAGPQSAAPGR